MTTTTASSANVARSTLPGYLAGKWIIDPIHSEVGFSARHMMVSKVRGKFTAFSGEIITGSEPSASSVIATIQIVSIDTANTDRDNHIRSADFLDVATFPTMTYKSSSVRADGNDFVVDGELTLKGVTKPMQLSLELGGFGPDAFGGTRAGFSATGKLSRSEFGVNFNAVIEAGGVVVSDIINISMEIEAVLAT